MLLHGCQIETFVWLAFGLLLIVLRLGVRVWLLGSFRSWRLDDYLMMFVAFLFTLECLISYFVYDFGTNNLDDKVRASLTEEQIRKREIGAKLLYTGWFVYFLLLWSLKTAMICFYKRLNLGPKAAVFLQILSWFVGLTAIAIVFTFIFTCWPISHNWQVVPNPGVKCTESWAYFGVTGLPNILTEFALLAIPIPIIFQIRISLRQKIPLFILFGLGGVTILTTVLRHAYIFRNIYESKLVTLWGTREAFVSIFVGNAPQLKPLYDLCYDKITGRIPSDNLSFDQDEERGEASGKGAVSRGFKGTPLTTVNSSRPGTAVTLPKHLSIAEIPPISPFMIGEARGSGHDLILGTRASLDIDSSMRSKEEEASRAPSSDIFDRRIEQMIWEVNDRTSKERSRSPGPYTSRARRSRDELRNPTLYQGASNSRRIRETRNPVAPPNVDEFSKFRFFENETPGPRRI